MRGCFDLQLPLNFNLAAAASAGLFAKAARLIVTTGY
jgi:hypothetical protein